MGKLKHLCNVSDSAGNIHHTYHSILCLIRLIMDIILDFCDLRIFTISYTVYTSDYLGKTEFPVRIKIQTNVYF